MCHAIFVILKSFVVAKPRVLLNRPRGFSFCWRDTDSNQKLLCDIENLLVFNQTAMKIPQFALNGSYLPTVSTSSYRNTPGNQSNQSNHGNQSNDNSPTYDNTLNSPVFSPTRGFTDEHNLMVDMAVAKDKTPFLMANKANDNLQRALNRFMVYHDRERKVHFSLSEV